MRVGCTRTRCVRWRFARPVCAGRHEALSSLRRPIELEPRPLIFLRVRHVRLTAYAAIRVRFFSLVEINKQLRYVCLPAGRPRARAMHTYACMVALICNTRIVVTQVCTIKLCYVHMMTKRVFFCQIQR